MAEVCSPFSAETNGVRFAVMAAAEKDCANQALIKLLAKEWRLAKSSIALVRGAKNRNRTLRVEGPAEPLFERLT